MITIVFFVGKSEVEKGRQAAHLPFVAGAWGIGLSVLILIYIFSLSTQPLFVDAAYLNTLL